MERMQTLVPSAFDMLFNAVGRSSTTQKVEVAEVARARTPVSEAQLMFGPSSVDEDLVARLDALRQQGFPALPGDAAFDS